MFKCKASSVKHSEKNYQPAGEESYLGEIELESEGSNEDWIFAGFLILVVNC